MPKRKSPYKVIPYQDRYYGDGWAVKTTNTTFHEELKIKVCHVCIMLNEAYAHGYRNGMREGDVVKALRSAYDGHSIQWKQRKTGEDIYLFAPKKLKEELDKSDKGSLYLVSRIDGGPYTQSSFRTMFFNRIRLLKDQGKLGNNLTFHGLRHTAAKNLAEAGCDTRDIAAVLGHKTDSMAKMYAEGESKKQRAKAAILKLEGTK